MGQGDDVASAAVRVRSGLGHVGEAVLLLGAFRGRSGEDGRAVLRAIEQLVGPGTTGAGERLDDDR